MNDPWEVKNVRVGHQYTSCMKINGVPLLPPVLSKECRKEMQYYKLLAIEVEKRISVLRPYVESGTESCDDRTDAPDITDCDDAQYAFPQEDKVEAAIEYVADEFSEKYQKSRSQSPKADKYNPNHTKGRDLHLLIDLNEIGDGEDRYRAADRSPRVSPIPIEIPERDCDYQKNTKKQKEKLNDAATNKNAMHKNLIDSIIDDIDIFSNKDDFMPLQQDGPSSLSSKSFTGSLHDIHAEVSKQSQGPKLIRQRSYTVLNPSPQLLAHLEVQSINTGVEMNSISMSESMSNLDSSPGKKRRSWDLESAKVKWSSMAMELKRKNIAAKSNSVNNEQSKNAKSNSVMQDRPKCNTSATGPRSEPNQKQKYLLNSAANTSAAKGKYPVKGSQSPNATKNAKPVSPKKEDNKISESISKPDDPATRVKKLYEKLQKQQLMQMANLMEKQKREQQLLQQVFEEQNNILLKQLKSVCPKASIEIKQAWGESKEDNDRGPVSLSQLINTSTPETSVPSSPVAKTLTESASCLNKCDTMLQKSRDITNSFRKPSNGIRSQKSMDQVPITPTHINSGKNVNVRNTSRRLNYDTTASSDAETIFTDRTNDTMADLNVTFPSDNSESITYSKSKVVANSRRVASNRACSPLSAKLRNNKEKAAIEEDHIQTSINTVGCTHSVTKQSVVYRQPSAKELVAASRIVACAKGYLVRRLMRTERVQTTVQTIRDALLCALQLHQDREGIRGADVDLHRRLIQQITAACYTLHDTFVSSTAAERCSMIATDRARRQALASKQPTPRRSIREDVMSSSHSGAFPARRRPSTAPAMSRSDYGTEMFSSTKPRPRYNMAAQRRVPWR